MNQSWTLPILFRIVTGSEWFSIFLNRIKSKLSWGKGMALKVYTLYIHCIHCIYIAYIYLLVRIRVFANTRIGDTRIDAIAVLTYWPPYWRILAYWPPYWLGVLFLLEFPLCAASQLKFLGTIPSATPQRVDSFCSRVLAYCQGFGHVLALLLTAIQLYSFAITWATQLFSI